MNTTAKELDSLFKSVDSIRKQLNIDPELDYVLQIGSSTNGRAYRLFGTYNTGTGLHSTTVVSSDGYLGMTKNETARALRFILTALGAAVDAR